MLSFFQSLSEFFYPAHGINHFFLASIKRMAAGANFHLNVFFGGTYAKTVSASAANLGIGIIFGMYIFFHGYEIIVPLNLLFVKTFSVFFKSVPLMIITRILYFEASLEATGSKGTFMPGCRPAPINFRYSRQLISLRFFLFLS
jgi:hypothetical protein